MELRFINQTRQRYFDKPSHTYIYIFICILYICIFILSLSLTIYIYVCVCIFILYIYRYHICFPTTSVCQGTSPRRSPVAMDVELSPSPSTVRHRLWGSQLPAGTIEIFENGITIYIYNVNIYNIYI